MKKNRSIGNLIHSVSEKVFLMKSLRPHRLTGGTVEDLFDPGFTDTLDLSWTGLDATPYNINCHFLRTPAVN